MNKNTKKQTKKLIIILIMITLCNFVMPNYAFAAGLNGGIFFKPIAQFIARVGDLVIQALQLVCVGDGTIQVESTEYLIRFSPGVIFSGEIPMFDINFITPAPDYKVYKMMPDYEELKYDLNKLGVSDNPYQLVEDNGIIYHFLKTGNLKSKDGTLLRNVEPVKEGSLTSVWNFGKADYKYEKVEDILKVFGIKTTDKTEFEYSGVYISSPSEGGPPDIDVTNVEYNGKKYDCVNVGSLHKKWHPETEGDGDYILSLDYYFLDLDTTTYDDEYIYIGQLTALIPAGKFVLVETGETITSTAKVLRDFVATWYNVFKEVSLVALLVVLVYVAIRMLLSTTSQDKAKYKKMLVDWFTAICIVFVLQYIISLILAVTGSISDFFAASVLGEHGEDVLMTEIRNMIGDTPDSFLEVFAEIVMYVILVVFTVLFTIQYLKRTIYVAFLTLISPLVAFTYPLDKIKDGKAQAFSAWLKEFVYSALVQPVHLVLYCMLVNSAIDLARELPIYAIIVMGFLLPAEKFVKEMFGLNKSSAVGSMASALGGATVMNAIKKMGMKGPKGSNGSAGEGNGNNSNVRTANTIDNQNNPFTGEEQTGDGQEEKTNVKKALKGFAKGTGKLATKYVFNKKNGKKLLRTAGKIAGASALGTVGFAAGISTGDMEKAFAGVAGGLAAGSRVGGNLVDGGANLLSGASTGLQGIKDTFGEGKYGEEAYAIMKQHELFRKSPEYGKLLNQYPGQEATVEAFLNSGITDARKMGTAMKNIKDRKYNLQEAIQYMKMADKCPAEILYDKDKFITYLTVRDIPEAEAEKIRKGIVDFK